MNLTKIEGYTATQLAQLAKKTRHAVEAWLSYNGVKPVINELLYPPETLDALLNAKVGRPRKQKAQEPAEAPKKPQKSLVRKSVQ